MELKSMLIDSKSAWVDFAGFDGFSVEVVNLSRKELQKLRKSCFTTTFDRKTRLPEDKFDEDKFVTLFAAKTIKNWKGLKLEYLEALILVDLKGKDKNEELPYSEENAEVLVSQSTEFDNWLNEVVFDLEFFRDESEGDDLGKTGKILPADGS